MNKPMTDYIDNQMPNVLAKLRDELASLNWQAIERALHSLKQRRDDREDYLVELLDAHLESEPIKTTKRIDENQLIVLTNALEKHGATLRIGYRQEDTGDTTAHVALYSGFLRDTTLFQGQTVDMAMNVSKDQYMHEMLEMAKRQAIDIFGFLVANALQGLIVDLNNKNEDGALTTNQQQALDVLAPYERAIDGDAQSSGFVTFEMLNEIENELFNCGILLTFTFDLDTEGHAVTLVAKELVFQMIV